MGAGPIVFITRIIITSAQKNYRCFLYDLLPPREPGRTQAELFAGGSPEAVLSVILSIFQSEQRDLDRQERLDRQFAETLSPLTSSKYLISLRAGVIQR